MELEQLEALMLSFLSRWRPGHVIAGWFVYWLGLAGVTLTPALLAIQRATSAPANTSTVSASLHGSTFILTIQQLGKVTYTASAPLVDIALWVGLPPLALYGLWLITRSRDRRLAQAGAPAALGAPPLEPLARSEAPERAAPSTPESRIPHA